MVVKEKLGGILLLLLLINDKYEGDIEMENEKDG
jgi:hypothetical protein